MEPLSHITCVFFCSLLVLSKSTGGSLQQGVQLSWQLNCSLWKVRAAEHTRLRATLPSTAEDPQRLCLCSANLTWGTSSPLAEAASSLLIRFSVP